MADGHLFSLILRPKEKEHHAQTKYGRAEPYQQGRFRASREITYYNNIRQHSVAE